MAVDFSKNATIVARELLGKTLVRTLDDGTVLKGIIVETEAYSGTDDLASHGRAKKTPRNIIMYGPPGYIYVYLIYGMYQMLNIIAEPEDEPAAILIRAVEPMSGIDVMKKLRGKDNVKNLCNGPGKLAQAFDIDKSLNGLSLGSEIQILDGVEVPISSIETSPRIGLGKSVQEPWLSKPWRWYIRDNPFVSRLN